MRPVKLKYSAPVGLLIWATCAALLCTHASCSITTAKLPEIIAVAVGFVVACIVLLSGLPQSYKLLRLPIWVLAIAYFVPMSYLTVKTYTPLLLLPTLLYPAWLLWTVLGVTYAVSADKISSTEANRPYKILRGAVWAVLGVTALYGLSTWMLNLFILAQVLVFVALLGGWRFVVWLKENFADSGE